MSDTARDYQDFRPTATEGLDELFDAEVVPGPTDPYQVGPTEGLPVEEAAKVLGLSVKTIKDRLRKGKLSGFKSKDRFGEKWMVCLDGADQVVPGPTELVGPTSPYQVGPTDGQSAVVEAYKEQIKELQNKLEAASYRLGFLEHERETYLEQIKLLTDSQHKPGWWARFKKWCAGQ